jgi:restriction system protein
MPPRTVLAALSFGAFATFAQLFLRFLNRGARSRVNTARWSPELLKQLDWRRFEQLCGALYEQDAERASILVQCQPWNAYRVGIKPVHGLVEAMAAANLAEGVLATPGKFTQEARDFARKQNTITLVDGAELLAKIAALAPEKSVALLRLATEGDFLTPTCPSCALKMVPRKSTSHGRKFWGCRNYPGCKQTFFSPL